jgi:hypothetical protein
MTKTLPRYEQVGTLRRPADFAAPLPPSLLARVGEKGSEHEELAGRYTEAARKTKELAGQLEQTKRADAEREREALKAGKPVPAAKAPKASEQLAESERQLAVLGDVLAESARELLAASIEHVAGAQEEVETTQQAALAEAEEHARLALSATERADAHAAEANWLGRLALNGVVPPWREGRRADLSPRASELLRRLGDAFAEDAYQVAERRAHTEREREVYEKEKRVPGQQVWRGGETFVVDAEGQLVKAEEVEQ